MKKSITEELTITFKDFPRNLLHNLVLAADKACINRIAIVGGIVRDFLIYQAFKEPIPDFQDIDILIEGSIDKFLNAIQEFYGKERVIVSKRNPTYKTIEIIVDNIRLAYQQELLNMYLILLPVLYY